MSLRNIKSDISVNYNYEDKTGYKSSVPFVTENEIEICQIKKNY